MEALKLLVALRLWAPQWQSYRVRLEVRAVHVTALTLITTMRGRWWALNTSARDIAQDYAKAAFRPAVCAHVPGVGLEPADHLSRRYEPGRAFHRPPEFAASAEAAVPERPSAWYRSLGPLQAVPAAESTTTISRC